MLEDINGRKDVKLAPRKQTEITIKGTAATGPFVVVGRNFAPGTNAADIEAAMEPVAGHIVGVHITSYTPYVNAQIACAEKWGAEAIVAQFNGQKVGLVNTLNYYYLYTNRWCYDRRTVESYQSNTEAVAATTSPLLLETALPPTTTTPSENKPTANVERGKR
jgi:hypothetical protein